VLAARKWSKEKGASSPPRFLGPIPPGRELYTTLPAGHGELAPFPHTLYITN